MCQVGVLITALGLDRRQSNRLVEAAEEFEAVPQDEDELDHVNERISMTD
jgi:hypothetical protein